MQQAAPSEKVAIRKLSADSEKREGQGQGGTVEQILCHFLAEAGAYAAVLVGDLIKELYVAVSVPPLLFRPVYPQLSQKRGTLL